MACTCTAGNDYMPGTMLYDWRKFGLASQDVKHLLWCEGFVPKAERILNWLRNGA